MERILATISFGLGPATRYLAAVALVTGALVLRLMIAPRDAGFPFLTFFPAAAFSAILGGLGPGLLAAGLCAGLAAWLFVDVGRLTGLLATAIFLLDGVVVCTAIEALRRYYSRTQAVTRDLERTVERLSEMNAELERFAHVASHDLREPLRSITSFAQLIARDYADRLDPRGRECLGFVADGAKRMHGMIGDLLTFSRVRLGVSRREIVDSRAALEGALDNLAEAVRSCSANVTVGALPEVWADRVQLTQVFQHLIDNAIKFRSPDRLPEIGITADRREDAWVFKVSDNGIGVGESDQDIFDIFRQLHPRGTYGGQGVGLAICRRIVQDHGGHIWAKSMPGEGSVFHFTIPAHRPGSRDVQSDPAATT